jgi:single-strand DNA-binding protein
MSGSVNKVILIGNLGQDPEVKTLTNGMKPVRLSVATSEHWKDKTTGEKKERTEWNRVVIMNEQLGEIAEKYLKKGSKVYLEGQLQTRKWMDKDNKEHVVTEVLIPRFNGRLVLLDNRVTPDANSVSQKKTNDDYIDDDIPF